MVTGVGATGGRPGRDAGDAPRRPERPTRPRAARCGRGARARPVGTFTPTTRFSTCSTLSMRPIVETGIFVPSVVIWPDGKVRLFAARTPVTWPERDAVLGELVRVERDGDPLLLAAGEVDAADALDAEQRGDDLLLGDRGGLVEAVLGRGGDRRDDHRRRVDVQRVDRAADGRRQARVLRGSARSSPGSP